MSCLNSYNFPEPTTPESNNSRSLRIRLPVRTDCPELPARSCQQLHNNARCASDPAYFQPVWAPENKACDDSQLTLRFLIDTVRPLNGSFGFYSMACGIDLRTTLNGVGRSPVQMAAAYVLWLTQQNLSGWEITAEGREIIIRFPAEYTECGCELAFSVATAVADGLVLEQPFCCKPVIETENCNLPTDFAEWVFRIYDNAGYVYGDPNQETVFRIQYEWRPCTPDPPTIFEKDLRMSYAFDFRDYLRKLHYHLQQFYASKWGRSVLGLDIDTGTFRMRIDRAFFQNLDTDICQMKFQLCIQSGGPVPLQAEILQQPQCCDGPLPPCVDNDIFTTFEVELFDEPDYVYGNPTFDVLYNIDYSNQSCPGNYFTPHVLFRLSQATDFESWVSQSHSVLDAFYRANGLSRVDRIQGTGRLVFHLDREYFINNIGFDPCSRTYMVCQYGNADFLFTRPPRVHVEISRQPRCCPPTINCSELEERSESGDSLILDFRFPDRRNAPGSMNWGWLLGEDTGQPWLLRAELLDSCCQPIAHPAERVITGAWVGIDSQNRSFQRLRIDPERMPDDCFSLRIDLNDPCGELSFYTEPWRKVLCGPTIRIEAVGLATACTDRPESPLPHLWGQWFGGKNTLRVPGSLEWVGLEREEEESGGRTTALRLYEVWRLRTGPLPVYVVQQLEALLSADTWWLGGLDFSPPNTLIKNRTRGHAWQIDTELRRLSCEQSKRCG